MEEGFEGEGLGAVAGEWALGVGMRESWECAGERGIPAPIPGPIPGRMVGPPVPDPGVRRPSVGGIDPGVPCGVGTRPGPTNPRPGPSGDMTFDKGDMAAGDSAWDGIPIPGAGEFCRWGMGGRGWPGNIPGEVPEGIGGVVLWTFFTTAVMRTGVGPP